MNKRSVGGHGEQLAKVYLEGMGLKLLEQNVYVGGSEIDLIMTDGLTLYFVEVKFRRSLAYGYPVEALTVQKRRHLKRACLAYLNQKATYQPFCISFLGILKTDTGYDYQWLDNIFS